MAVLPVLNRPEDRLSASCASGENPACALLYREYSYSENTVQKFADLWQLCVRHVPDHRSREVTSRHLGPAAGFEPEAEHVGHAR